MSTMLSTNSLQPPKTGVSRWSKALPEVPGIDFDDIYGEYGEYYDDEDDKDDRDVAAAGGSPANKGLPRLPIAPPPPRSTSMSTNAKSLNSSLPPLPIVDTAPPAPMMAIPRRPVGKQALRTQPQPQPQVHQSQQQQQLQQHNQQQLQLQQQQQQQQHQLQHNQWSRQQHSNPLPHPPSPAQSISSILSAYSKDSADNSNNTNTRQSGANSSSSPSHSQAPPANTKTDTLISASSTDHSTTSRLLQQQKDVHQQQHPLPQPPLQQQHHVAPTRPAKITVDTDIPPPPPSKDSKYGLVASPATAKSASSTATPSDLTTSSPPRPQIWRRRSVKTERNLDLPDLKLVGSHGSTAASASATAATSSTADTSSSLPASVRPVASIKRVGAAVAQAQAQLQSHSHTRAQSGSKTASQPATQSKQPYLPPGVIKVSTLTYQAPRPNNHKLEPTATATATATVNSTTNNNNIINSNNTTSNNNNTNHLLSPSPAPAPAAISAPLSAPAPIKAIDADSPTMGNGSSKLNKLKDKLQTLHRRGKSSVDTASDSTGRPGTNRPPTPEYQKQDVKTPIIDSFVSPLSPASSPEPAAEVSPEPVLPPPSQLPHLNGLPSDPRPPARKALPPASTFPIKSLPEAEPVNESFPPMQKEPVRPVADHKLNGATESDAPLTASLPPLATDAGSRPSSGTDSPASRAHHAAEVPTKFPPRGSSVRSNAPRPYEHQYLRHTPEDMDPRLVPSDSQGYLYRGRDGTLYPEMRVTRDPDPEASYFPKQTERPVPVDTIFRSVPLKDSHYNCYQGHRTMNRRTNRNYPLTCQTCERPDTEDRWVCTFCHLRICETCFTTLNGRQRNLTQLVQDVNQQMAYS